MMGVCWALWHLPAWFDPNLPHHMFPLLPAMISIATFGVFMSFVFFRSGGSVLATIAAHLSFNVMTGLLGVNLASPVFWWVLAGLFGAFTVTWTVLAELRHVQKSTRT
jgi:membrane protease YdiL (CAAX protease family)